MADPSVREIINVVDSYFSQCGGPTCKGEHCDLLCGGPKSDENVNHE